jgi:spore germination protein KC
MKKLLLLIFFIPFLSGCWSYREINDLAIVTGFAVEEVDDEIKVSAQIMKIQKNIGQSQFSQEMFYVLEATGKTLQEAFRKITLHSSKTLYVSHIKILIIDEKLAKKGIKEILDFPLRDTEIRSEFHIFVSKDTKAGDILKVITPLTSFSASSIEDTLETSSQLLGKTKLLTYTNFLRDYVEEGIENIVNSLYIEGNIEQGENMDELKETKLDTIIYLGNIGVLKDDKLLGWLTDEESYGYNFISNDINTTIINIPCDNDKNKFISIEILKSNSSIDVKMKDDKPTTTIKIKGYGLISEVECGINLENEKIIKKIIKDTNSHVKKLVENTILEVQQKYKSDIFGFGKQLHKKDYKAWNKIKKNWDDVFPNMKVTVDVNYELPEEGTTINVLKDRD